MKENIKLYQILYKFYLNYKIQIIGILELIEYIKIKIISIN